MSRPVPLGRRIVSALAGIAAAALLAVAAWQGYREVIAQPFAHVVFTGDLDRLPQRDLEALTRSIQAATPAQSSLADVREAARRVPWVREATVRRSYPGTVEIRFEAHRALARWNEAQLVSPEGAVFTAEEPAALPRFRGPDGNAPEMAREYPRLTAALAPLESPIAELRLSARGAWQVALQSGLVLDLGRGEVTARAERLAAAWPQLVGQGMEVKQVDLRYPNGFALRTKLTLAPPQGRGRAP
jgi:cell division protein FtsQ